MSKQKCQGRVYRSGLWGSSSCSRRGIIERNGEWYCRQHDPVAKAARDAKRDAKWAAEREAADVRDRQCQEDLDRARRLVRDAQVRMLTDDEVTMVLARLR